MKISKLLVIFLAILFSANLQAQSPQSINYQAVVRDANGVVVMNRVVAFRLSILTGGSTGTPQYVETHNATTNTFGLVTLNIGLGTPTTGAMSSVTWATGSKFLRVEVDINGGSNFTALGTTQFLSVPYALYAATSGSSAASGWGLSGNTVTSANYIGTNNLEDVRFYANNTQKMVLKTSGYVGIGTNTPDFKMVIENDAASTAGIDDGRTLLQLHNKSFASFATTNLRIKTGNTSNVTMLSHYGPTYTQYPNFADYGLMLSTGPGLMMQAPAGNIRFMTGPAPNSVGINDRMVITNTGYVGVGTVTPDFKMVIENDAASTAGIDDGRTLLQLHNKSFASFATTNLRIKTGNTSNVTMLSHYGPTYTQYPNFADYGLMLSTGPGLMMQAPAGNIRFMTGPAPNSVGIYDRMVITNEGNVGIGTTQPNGKLHIVGNDDGAASGADGRFFVRIDNQNTSNAAQSGIQFMAGGSSAETTLGHVSPTYSIYSGFGNFGQLRSSGSGVIIQAGSSSGIIKFQTGGISDRILIDAAGNVGIGTTTPKAKLEVTSGDVYVNDSTRGIILKSPNGGCWRVTMDNTGNFVRTSIACPN